MDWKTALLDRHLYVLESANSKFYVGQAVDPDRRIRKHFNGTGSQWTRLHPPMKILSCESLGVVDYRSAEHAENDLVLSLMRTHGFKNVRGGFFTNVNAELIAKSLIAHGYQTLINEQLRGARPDLTERSITPPSTSKAPGNTGEYSLFVLRLEHDKYFVGYSSNPDHRIKRHFSGRGSEWTSLYKPTEVIIVKSLGMIPESDAALAADLATVTMMRKVGWRNVRGGPWWSPKDEEVIRVLRARGYHDLLADQSSSK